MKSTIFLFFLTTFLLGKATAQERPAGMDAYIKAETLREKGQYKEAIAAYDAAVALEPQNLSYKTIKCQCYLNMFEVKQAITCFEKVSLEHPKDTSSLETLANLHATAQSVDNAALYFEKAAAQSLSNDYKLSCYLNILNLLHIQNKMRKAGGYLKEAQKANPEHFDLLFFEAEYQNVMGNYEAALAAISKVVAQLPQNKPFPEFSKYYYQKTRAHFNLGQYAPMREALKHMIDEEYVSLQKFFTSDFHYGIGDTYFKTYLYGQSMEALTLAIKLDSNNQKARMLRSEIYRVQSDVQKPRLEELEKGWKEDLPKDKLSPRLAELTMLHFNAGNYPKSLDKVREYLVLNPLQHEMYMVQAANLLLLKKPNEAADLLEPMVKVDKLTADIKSKSFMLLAFAYLELKEYRKAYSMLKKASYGDFAEAAGWHMKHIRESYDLEKGE